MCMFLYICYRVHLGLPFLTSCKGAECRHARSKAVPLKQLYACAWVPAQREHDIIGTSQIDILVMWVAVYDVTDVSIERV